MGEFSLVGEAISRVNADRPIYVGGAVSNFGLISGGEWHSVSRCRLLRRNAITDDQALDNLKEQAEILAMAGVDFMMVESTGNLIQRIWVSEACASVGLPIWTGFKVHKDEGDPKVKIGYFGSESLSQALQEVIPWVRR